VGLGLGLFIAHEIARTHGGKMWATSCPEEGTQFSALLPRRI
jgi:signal transduction histidine kinase